MAIPEVAKSNTKGPGCLNSPSFFLSEKQITLADRDAHQVPPSGLRERRGQWRVERRSRIHCTLKQKPTHSRACTTTLSKPLQSNANRYRFGELHAMLVSERFLFHVQQTGQGFGVIAEINLAKNTHGINSYFSPQALPGILN